MTFLVPQTQAVVSDAPVRVTQTAARPVQKRWPMALSIWAAIAVSLAMWAGIAWTVTLFLGLFT
ncbi:MAG: hypothetical protein R3C30_06695 [Hyphomonadaceae bacterium]